MARSGHPTTRENRGGLSGTPVHSYETEAIRNFNLTCGTWRSMRPGFLLAKVSKLNRNPLPSLIICYIHFVSELPQTRASSNDFWWCGPAERWVLDNPPIYTSILSQLWGNLGVLRYTRKKGHPVVPYYSRLDDAQWSSCRSSHTGISLSHRACSWGFQRLMIF